MMAAASCGGGGGGGGSGGGGSGVGGGGSAPATNDPNSLFLSAAYFARPIFDVNNTLADLVNPSSVSETDPVTGVLAPGFPAPLVAGTSLTELEPIDFTQILDPITPQIPIIPRNAALVLEFSQVLLPASLNLSQADPLNPDMLGAASTIQIQRQDGSVVTARAVVVGNRVVLHGITTTSPGFESSPLVFDKFGAAVADPAGYLRVVTGVGVGSLASTDGKPLVPRTDALGTVAKPLPFNPGNSKLDAIVLQTATGTVSFNGFLPDTTPPRIIRAVELPGTIDSVNQGLLELTASPFGIPPSLSANGGLGEWANALLTVTGLGGVITKYVVVQNKAAALPPNKPIFVLAPGSAIDQTVVPGSTFVLRRSEFFEPIPPPLPSDPAALAKITVDAVNRPRDPNDAQDLLNHDLRYFVRMFDPSGVERTTQWNPAENLFGANPGKFLAVPPKTELRIQFNEPMDPSSFRPYENFFVADLAVQKTETGFGRQRIGKVQASADSRTIRFLPYLDDQVAPGNSSFIGFGGTASSLKLVLRTLPSQADITSILANASPSQTALMVDLGLKGVLGITDLGGRGLGLPPAMLDQGDNVNFLLQSSSPGRSAFPPAVDFQVAFETTQTADPDYGAVVHRFMGQATTSTITYPQGSVSDTVTSGVEYADYPPLDVDFNGTIDRRFIYGPIVFDIGLNLPGRLTGAPGSTIEHLVDNFNKPKNSPYASPNGEDFLTSLGFGATTPLNSPFGARFQHVYRAGDASPSYNDFSGIVLDLVGLAWAPLGGNVVASTIDDMSVLVGLSGVNNADGPNTNQGSGIPAKANSGLIQQFDCNLLEFHDACCVAASTIPPNLAALVPNQPKLTTVVSYGTQYSINTAGLFNPLNAANKPQGTFNKYINYPAFNAGVDPYFGKTNVASFPYDSIFPMLVEYRIKPQKSQNFPALGNVYAFSPGILTSVLPRFRVWSQGQDPLAWGVPNIGAGCQPGNPPPCTWKAGEGGPLIEPGQQPIGGIPAPAKSNGMPAIPETTYITPPQIACVPNQPLMDKVNGNCATPTPPKANTNPDINFYWANGMLAYPLPNLTDFPGPGGQPPTQFCGYGPAGTGNTPPFVGNEPNYTCLPGDYGDNARYFMMWKYQKRVSIIESPTVTALTPTGFLEYATPIVDPPQSSVDPAAGLKLEYRAGTQLNFAVSSLQSGYVLPTDPAFSTKMSGVNKDRIFVKFRATFGLAPGQNQPPSIDTIVIPFKKVAAP